MGFRPGGPPPPSATVNAESYGAVGDGVTDDTTALRAALATGMSVVIPAGTYITGKLSNLFPMLGATISGQTDIGPAYTSGINAVATRMWGGLI